MIAIFPPPQKNHLLAALPEAEWLRWLPQLEPVEMPLGKVLYESGSTLNYVYFPTTAIVSLLYLLENGASAEIAVVGNEGVVGVSLFGVRPDEQRRLVTARETVRVYVPFGVQWYGYLMRRMAERPANTALFLRALTSRS